MTISPGWYPDPVEPGIKRYWDGEGWLGEPLPVQAPTPDGPPAEPPRAMPPAQATVLAATTRAPQTEQPSSGWPVVPPTGTSPAQPGPYAKTGPVRPHGLSLASPGARLLARLIDTAAVLALNVLVNGWFVYLYLRDFLPWMRDSQRVWLEGGDLFSIPPPEQLSALQIVIVLIAMALWFAYEVPATAHGGQTLGKRLTRIKVVAVESAQPLGVRRAWRRWNPLGLPLLLLGCCGPLLVVLQIMDVSFILVDRMQRMALHDRSAATYVVQLPASPRSTRSESAGRPSEERKKP